MRRRYELTPLPNGKTKLGFDRSTRAVHPGQFGDGDWVAECAADPSSNLVRPTVAQIVFLAGMIGLGQRTIFGIDETLDRYIGGDLDEVLEAETPKEVFLIADAVDIKWARIHERQRR